MTDNNERAELAPEALAELAAQVLGELLTRMRFDTKIETEWTSESSDDEDEPDQPVLLLNVTGEELENLPGPRGETIAALQYLVRTIVSRSTLSPANIVVDVEGYKARRTAQLQSLAGRVADQVSQSRRPVTLEPMPAYERRVIHMALRGHPMVTTASNGEGEHRKITVTPR